MKRDRQHETDFISPLQIDTHTPFTYIGFGQIPLSSDVRMLRSQMNESLFQFTSVLPPPLAKQAKAIFSAYSGGDRDFYRLFYSPVWSFLHWMPPGESGEAAARFDIKKAHALSLFIHLWDDHLCDKQLSLDLLRLQIRTEAWNEFVLRAHTFCTRNGIDPAFVDECCDTYLCSIHDPLPVRDTAAYGRRFVKQISIWKIAPYLLGFTLEGAHAANDLSRIVEQFGIAWRYLDDLQDVHLDVIEAKETAVWLELDDIGRSLWKQCRYIPQYANVLDFPPWTRLVKYIRSSGTLNRLLTLIVNHLTEAEQLANSNGWIGIGAEIKHCIRQIESNM